MAAMGTSLDSLIWDSCIATEMAHTRIASKPIILSEISL